MLNQNNYEALVNKVNSEVAHGATEEEILVELRKKEISIIDAIRVVHEVFGISLLKAKNIVSSHPDWIAVHEAHEQFHEDLNNELAKTTKSVQA